MENNNLKYSILIPAYNAEKYIERSLNSVLNQKSEYNYEIIICDDGSTDNTVNIVNKIKNNKVKLIKNDVNKGGIITRKKLILEAQGDYIIWLDADDEYSSETLTTLDEYVYNNKYDIINLSFQFVYPNNNKSHCILPNKTIHNTNMLNEFFSMPLKWYLWGKAIKREIMLKQLPPDWNYVMDDVFFALPMYYYAKEYISINSEPLYFYYYGLGYWSGDFYVKERNFTYDDFIKCCEVRKAEFKYNYNFLLQNNLSEQYVNQLMEACDLASLFYHMVKINNEEDRFKALSQINEYLIVGLSIKL